MLAFAGDPIQHRKRDLHSELIELGDVGRAVARTAVIGIDDPALVKGLIAYKGWWMDAGTASNEFAWMPHPQQKMPEDFRRALIANYGSRTDLEKKLGQEIEYSWEQEEAPSRN